MVLPDYVLEAVDALPDEESWDLIRAYLDTGGDVDDVDAESDGLTMLSQFLICHDMRDEASLRFSADFHHRTVEYVVCCSRSTVAIGFFMTE